MRKSNIFILILVILVIIGIAALIFVSSNPDNENRINNTNNNSNNSHHNQSNIHRNHNNSIATNNVVAILDGPSSASEGSMITVKWTVTNKGSAQITNVKAISQYGDYDFGNIASGESKSTSFEIPSYGPYEDESNESDDDKSLFIGGFSLEYDFNGKHYQINSNSIEVSLN